MFLSVIEFEDPTGEVMVARIPMDGTGEFVMGSQLIVQDGQLAVFYRDGTPADIFYPGRYTLDTENLPLITKLLNLPVFGRRGPFRAYIYYLMLKTFIKLGWGTSTPVLYRDAEFKAVHLRAHGIFSMRISEPSIFLRTIVGSKGFETTFEIEEYARSIIVSRLASVLPKVITTILDLPVHYREIEVMLKSEVKEDIGQYGLELVDLMVEAITVPPEVQKMIDRAAGSRSLADSEVQRYQAIAMSDALRDSSQKPTGGGMSEGFGIAAGFMMGQTQAGSQQQPPTPPKTAQAKEILWYFASEGQKKGPYGDEAMRVQIENGRITRETLVWCQGMQNWTPAGNCPELKFFFEESPPPLPPG